jgi:hypothetical protein
LKEQAKGIYFVKVVGSRFVEFRKLVLIWGLHWII